VEITETFAREKLESDRVADLRGDNIDYRILSGESRIANPGTVEE
jgi:hypothetical protein